MTRRLHNWELTCDCGQHIAHNGLCDWTPTDPDEFACSNCGKYRNCDCGICDVEGK